MGGVSTVKPINCVDYLHRANVIEPTLDHTTFVLLWLRLPPICFDGLFYHVPRSSPGLPFRHQIQLSQQADRYRVNSCTGFLHTLVL